MTGCWPSPPYILIYRFTTFLAYCAGGALVMVMENQRRDPHAWCELIQRHQVTLWNSVPALFDMLLTGVKVSPTPRRKTCAQ